MRRLIIPAVLLLVSCSLQTAGKSNLPEPTIELNQLSRIADPNRNTTGPLSVQFQVTVTNNAAQAIELRRVDLQSVGFGSYNLSASHPFSLSIAPGATESASFWASGSIDTSSLNGANGPVTLRAALQFESAAGGFQSTVIRSVNRQGSGD
ncbi:MAG: hypothetical protein ABIP63_03715 [Thermoanaerobaculia bacterium]